MNLLFEFPEPLTFLNAVPWWGWAAACAGVVLILIIIIAVAVSKSKKKKKAKAEKDTAQPANTSASTQEAEPANVQKAEPVSEQKAEPVKEEVKVAEPVKEKKPAEVVKEEEKEEPEKPVAKKTVKVVPVNSKPVQKKTVKVVPAKTADKPTAKVYHISKRKEDNRWQIRAEGGAKAIKLFNTQKEAIDYCKTLANNQEARIMIHKEDGSFRKLSY